MDLIDPIEAPGRPADEPGGATRGERPLRIEIGLIEGSLTITGDAEQLTITAQGWHEDIEMTGSGARVSRTNWAYRIPRYARA